MPTDPRDDPMAKLDTLRCDTRALDAGALRAIQAAYASGAEHAAAGAPIDPLAAEPANDAAPPSDTRAPDVLQARPREAPTLEVDYSPTTRVRRARAAGVQRAARVITILCLAAGATLGVWAALRSDGDLPPRPAAQPTSVAAALTLPLASDAPAAAAPAPPDPPPPSSFSSTPESTVPTPPAPPAPARPAPGGPAMAPPLLGATAPGPVAAPFPASVGPAPSAAPTSPPSGTVPPPPGGTVALPLPD